MSFHPITTGLTYVYRLGKRASLAVEIILIMGYRVTFSVVYLLTSLVSRSRTCLYTQHQHS